MFKKKILKKTAAQIKKPEKTSSGTGQGGGGAGPSAKASLGGWIKTAEVPADQGSDEACTKKNTLILKFIEGHTNAVRRRVHLLELLAPWREF